MTPREETGRVVTTPLAKAMIGLLGPGLRTGPVVFTPTETEALKKLYGFKPEKPNTRPPKPVFKVDPSALPYQREDAKRLHEQAVARWEKWEDPMPLMQAGADRNMARHAEADGLRLIAWLAKYVPEGEDPLWRGKWNPSGQGSQRKRGVKYRWGKKKGLRRARRRYGQELIRKEST